jgi:hypothetical protein
MNTTRPVLSRTAKPEGAPPPRVKLSAFPTSAARWSAFRASWFAVVGFYLTTTYSNHATTANNGSTNHRWFSWNQHVLLGVFQVWRQTR